MTAKGLTRAAHGQMRGRARLVQMVLHHRRVLGVLAVIDTVSTSAGGIFANAAIAVGVVMWATVTSIVMVPTSS